MYIFREEEDCPRTWSHRGGVVFETDEDILALRSILQLAGKKLKEIEPIVKNDPRSTDSIRKETQIAEAALEKLSILTHEIDLTSGAVKSSQRISTMKTSETIEYMRDNYSDSYNSAKARDLYNKGMDYHFLSICKWIGFVTSAYSAEGRNEPCGYCFKYLDTSLGVGSHCSECPLTGTLDSSCADYSGPLATLKNILRVYKKLGSR